MGPSWGTGEGQRSQVWSLSTKPDTLELLSLQKTQRAESVLLGLKMHWWLLAPRSRFDLLTNIPFGSQEGGVSQTYCIIMKTQLAEGHVGGSQTLRLCLVI